MRFSPVSSSRCRGDHLWHTWTTREARDLLSHGITQWDVRQESLTSALPVFLPVQGPGNSHCRFSCVTAVHWRIHFSLAQRSFKWAILLKFLDYCGGGEVKIKEKNLQVFTLKWCDWLITQIIFLLLPLQLVWCSFCSPQKTKNTKKAQAGLLKPGFYTSNPNRVSSWASFAHKGTLWTQRSLWACSCVGLPARTPRDRHCHPTPPPTHIHFWVKIKCMIHDRHPNSMQVSPRVIPGPLSFVKDCVKEPAKCTRDGGFCLDPAEVWFGDMEWNPYLVTSLLLPWKDSQPFLLKPSD